MRGKRTSPTERPSRRRALIYGAGGHGKVTLDIVRSLHTFAVVGILDDTSGLKELEGVPVLGGGSLLKEWKRKRLADVVILAVGDGEARRKLARLCRSAGFEIAGFRHNRATVSDRAAIDPTAMIWPHAAVNVAARIGESVILNTGCLVEHDTEIGAFSHVAPGTVICGGCRIGEGTWIGAGATVIQRVRIGAGSFIGAGSVVVGDIPAGVKAFGVPCVVRGPVS